MESQPDNINNKKEIPNTRSCNNCTTPLQFRGEPTKRKSFTLDEALVSLDLALGRMKKSKLGLGEDKMVAPSHSMLAPPEMAMDISSDSGVPYSGGMNSMMSMNFSHYELVRNLSRSTSMSEGGYSGTTCTASTGSDKDEFLEKYFRSIDVWNKMHCKDPSNMDPGVPFKLPDK